MVTEVPLTLWSHRNRDTTKIVRSCEATGREKLPGAYEPLLVAKNHF